MAKKEAARQAKIAKAKVNNEKVAARKARMEAMKAKLGGSVDISEVGEGQVVELGAGGNENARKDPRTKEGVGSECATCRSTSNLDEDCDNKGVWYCASCWNQWEDEGI